MQVYSQKPSSYPNQQRRETFGAVTRLTRVTPNFSTQWFTRFLQWHARLLHHRTYPVLPWKAWFTGIAQIKGPARAGDAAATYLLLRSPQKTAAKAGWLPHVQRFFPGALGQSGPGHRLSSHTWGCSATLYASTPQQPERFWGQNQPSVLVCLPPSYPWSEPKALLAKAHLPKRHLASTFVSDKEEKSEIFAVVCFNAWSHPLLRHTSFEYLKPPYFNIHISNYNCHPFPIIAFFSLSLNFIS